jgi:hypothetical protein
VGVPEQLTLDDEEDGLTWHEWVVSLPLDPDGDDDAQEPQDWLEETA